MRLNKVTQVPTLIIIGDNMDLVDLVLHIQVHLLESPPLIRCITSARWYQLLRQFYSFVFIFKCHVFVF